MFRSNIVVVDIGLLQWHHYVLGNGAFGGNVVQVLISALLRSRSEVDWLDDFQPKSVKVAYFLS